MVGFWIWFEIIKWLDVECEKYFSDYISFEGWIVELMEFVIYW